MSITEAQAEAYVRPMGQAKFDSAVGKILMNADLVGGVQVSLMSLMSLISLISLSLSLGLKSVFLYTVGVLFHVKWCIT